MGAKLSEQVTDFVLSNVGEEQPELLEKKMKNTFLEAICQKKKKNKIDSNLSKIKYISGEDFVNLHARS